MQPQPQPQRPGTSVIATRDVRRIYANRDAAPPARRRRLEVPAGRIGESTSLLRPRALHSTCHQHRPEACVTPPRRSVRDRRPVAIYLLGSNVDRESEVAGRWRGIVNLKGERTQPDHSLVLAIAEAPEVGGDIPRVRTSADFGLLWTMTFAQRPVLEVGYRVAHLLYARQCPQISVTSLGQNVAHGRVNAKIPQSPLFECLRSQELDKREDKVPCIDLLGAQRSDQRTWGVVESSDG